MLITHHYQTLSAVGEVKQFLHRHAEHAGVDRTICSTSFSTRSSTIMPRKSITSSTAWTRSRSRSSSGRPPQLVTELVHLKRRVIALRKTLILMREVLARLIRGEFELVDDREIVYYRNVFDHLVRYTELIEGAREMVSDLMQTHLAAQSNKLNGIMKALAMVSTVILPMSLISGIYGMNFKNMPELEWHGGYYMALRS